MPEHIKNAAAKRAKTKGSDRKPLTPAPGRKPHFSAGSAPSRDRILNAAESVFSKKGFDGARVDEIAAAAGLNKALIYYYFKDKQDLLLEIVNRLIKEIVALKREIYSAPLSREDLFNNQLHRLMEVVSKRMEIFAILVMESAKGGGRHPDILRVYDMFFESNAEFIEKLGLDARRLSRLRAPAFFFGLAPLLFYHVLKDRWASHYKIAPKDFERQFYHDFWEYYGSVARSFLKAKK
jgi:AcrR family transcriptional regulator